MEKAKIAKTTMSLEAETHLNQMVGRSNENFTGGRVTKHDLLSWIVICFAEDYFEKNIERIHQDHFDRLTHIDNIVKRIKKARHKGVEDQEAELLLKHLVDNVAKPKERQPRQKKLAQEVN